MPKPGSAGFEPQARKPFCLTLFSVAWAEAAVAARPAARPKAMDAMVRFITGVSTLSVLAHGAGPRGPPCILCAAQSLAEAAAVASPRLSGQQFSFWWTGVRPKDPTGLEKDWAASFGRLGLIQGRDGGARQPAERRAALL